MGGNALQFASRFKLSSYQHNANRQHERLRFFETGLVFQRSGEAIQQEARVGGLIGRKPAAKELV